MFQSWDPCCRVPGGGRTTTCSPEGITWRPGWLKVGKENLPTQDNLTCPALSAQKIQVMRQEIMHLKDDYLTLQVTTLVLMYIFTGTLPTRLSYNEYQRNLLTEDAACSGQHRSVLAASCTHKHMSTYLLDLCITGAAQAEVCIEGPGGPT